METHFDEELKILKQKLLQMGDMAQDMIRMSIAALKERRESLTEDVFTAEEKVNRFEIEIEDEALVLMATRQPAARDLRLLTAILKINNDLERIADQAVNIAEIALYLIKEPELKPLIDIPLMAALAQKMVRNSLNAFVYHDPALAKEVCEKDDEVDCLNDQIFRELLTYMMENPLRKGLVQRAEDWPWKGRVHEVRWSS